MHLFPEKRTELDGCSIMINISKCPFKSKHEPIFFFFTGRLAFALVSVFQVRFGVTSEN